MYASNGVHTSNDPARDALRQEALLLEAQKTMLEQRIVHLRRSAAPSAVKAPSSNAAKDQTDAVAHSPPTANSKPEHMGQVKRSAIGQPTHAHAKGPKRPKKQHATGEQELPSGQLPRVEDLFARCRKILVNLKRQTASRPFRKPVDPVAQGCPNYYEIVKKPMDFQTIGEKLGRPGERRGYGTVLEFRDDVRQVFVNCREYNLIGHPVRTLGDKLSARFESMWAESGIEGAWEAFVSEEQVRRSWPWKFPDILRTWCWAGE